MLNVHASFPSNYSVIHESAATPRVAAEASSRISSWTAVESRVVIVIFAHIKSKFKDQVSMLEGRTGPYRFEEAFSRDEHR